MATRANWHIASREEAPECVRPFMDEDGYMRVLPHLQKNSQAEGPGMDGFFAVRIVRNLPKD